MSSSQLQLDLICFGGVFNNDSLDQVFPCVFVGLVLFSVACLELLIAISSCPGAMFLLKSKLVEVWES